MSSDTGMSANGNASQSSSKPALAKQTHIRGTITDYSDNTLKVETKDGQTVKVGVDDKTKVAGLKKAEASDIGKGDFVGIASIPGKGGGSDAVEVLIFPAAMKGAGEGSYSWDLTDDSSMTNATVANAVKNVDGRKVTLTYNGGQEKTISIPKDTPIVTIAKATRDDLKKGNKVFVSASGMNGNDTASMIMVGNNGVAPPM
ncbi:hypothetical protein FJU11_04945 [Pararhizobium mangrovi]|uniref:DUF5666 domain-containing protein n=2 Tax=Pararhizobium mangrovi TaxID=2590452 RepID=A0A506UF90_9HYPH|nr:hypothetical protein FJU11_04945 [Pararhizobium mangrovi]